MEFLSSKRLIFLAVVVLLHAAPASAQTCEVSASGVNFGIYSPDALSDSDSTGTITLRCSNLVSLLVPYSIALSSGFGASYSNRALVGAVNNLQYQLYSDSARSMVWGDGSGGTTTVDGVVLLQAIIPLETDIVVYSRIPALQETAAGDYTDTIIVTVTF